MQYLRAFAVMSLMAAAPAAHAKPAMNLYNFGAAPDGASPAGVTLIDGVIYGTTNLGGTNGTGSLYKYDPATGIETQLYSFQVSGGNSVAPSSELLEKDGLLYGTVRFGGSSNLGILYSYDLGSGTYKTLFTFEGNGPRKYNGTYPNSGLTAVGRLLYGTCAGGGTNNTYGTIFSYDPMTGKEKTLYLFFTPQDGYIGNPVGPLVYLNGALYGAATFGGASSNGAVFKYDIASKTVTTLYSFNTTTDGFPPTYGLTYNNGFLYGILVYGGTNFGGTVFRIDPKNGREKVVHVFSDAASGTLPDGPLKSVGSTLYGTLGRGGKFNAGGVYSLGTSGGGEALVTSFRGGTHGSMPSDTLGYADGKLYGTTFEGGSADNGTIFEVRK